MKKLMNWIKKIFLMVGLFLNSVYTRVLASDIIGNIEVLYGPPPQELYGVVGVSKIQNFWKILRGLIIPIAFIIGVIVYFKKSTSSVSKKIITILIVLAIIVLLCFGINYLIKLI